MSPRITLLLTFVGVLLVGVPLPLLTRVAEKQTPAAAVEPIAANVPAWAVVSCTGKPKRLQLRLPGKEWIQVDTTETPSDFEMVLPMGNTVEIELQAEWGSPEVQAISLGLEPEGLDERTATQWKEEGSTMLHSIFSFKW